MPAQWHTENSFLPYTEPQATSFHGLVGQLGGGCRGCARWNDAAWLAQLVRFALEGILHLNAAHKTPSIRLLCSHYTIYDKASSSFHTNLQGWYNVSVRKRMYILDMCVCIYRWLVSAVFLKCLRFSLCKSSPFRVQPHVVK